MSKGKNFPKEVIEHWPEIFGEITLNVVPLQYLHSITVTFKNQKIWEVKINNRQVKNNWEEFESHLKEMLSSYESEIDNVDFKLDTERVKKDVIKTTNKFLKKKQL